MMVMIMTMMMVTKQCEVLWSRFERKLTRRGNIFCLGLERPVSSNGVARGREILGSHSDLREDSVLSSYRAVSIGK